MTIMVKGLLALTLAGAVPAIAADANHPYSNVNHGVDAGNNTGDSQTDQLNQRELQKVGPSSREGRNDEAWRERGDRDRGAEGRAGYRYAPAWAGGYPPQPYPYAPYAYAYPPPYAVPAYGWRPWWYGPRYFAGPFRRPFFYYRW